VTIEAMYAVATFLIVSVFTLVFGQFATGALIATGLPPEVAAFQARSAFSGAGFTTTETENVVNHPLRRRIIMTTMFVGSLGTPTLIVTVLVGLIVPGPGSTMERSLVVVSGTLLILSMIANRSVRGLLVRIGQRYTSRRLVPALGGEVEELVVVADDFIVGVVQLKSEPGDTYRSLRALADALTGCTVLGVHDDDGYAGAPPSDVDLHRGNALVVYGRREDVKRLVEGA